MTAVQKLAALMRQEEIRYPALLFVLCGVLFFVQLGMRGLWDPDETRYAEIAREMLERGDYVVPHLNGVPYLDKPPLYLWLVAASFSLFGINEYAARLPNALIALAGVFAIYALGRRLYNPRIGFWGGCLLAASALYTALAHIVLIDMVLTCFITLSLLCFSSGYACKTTWKGPFYLGMYFFSALAVLTKGPVGVAVPGGSILLFLALRGEWKRLLEMRLVSGSLLFAVVAVPWYLLISWRVPTYLRFFFVEQNLSGFVRGEVHHPYPFYMSLPMLLSAFMPWSPFLLCLMCSFSWKGVLRRLKEDAGLCFLMGWAVVPFALFTVSAAKLSSYFLPALPPLALLMVVGWERLAATGEVRRIKNVHTAGLAVTVLGSVGALIGVYMYPAFHQLILESDRTLLVMLVIVMLILLGACVVAFSLIPRGKWTVGAGSILIAYVLTGLVVFPFLRSIEDARSPKKVGTALRPHLKKGDVVATYHALAKGLVFYLRRPVLMVGKTRDYDQGLPLVSDPKKHVITDTELWALVRSGQRVFIFLYKEKQAGIPVEVRSRLSILAEDSYQMVLTNQPSRSTPH